MGLVGGWKTASFLVGSESDVRHWGPWPAGPVRRVTSISYARTSGRCDIAFRWDDDGLLEFGRKPLLSAPPCRMLDMCANMRGLQPGH